MISNIRALNDAELDLVSAGKGLDCAAARYVSNINETTAIALQAMGNYEGANYFIGKAQGNLDAGGCPQ